MLYVDAISFLAKIICQKFLKNEIRNIISKIQTIVKNAIRDDVMEITINKNGCKKYDFQNFKTLRPFQIYITNGVLILDIADQE